MGYDHREIAIRKQLQPNARKWMITCCKFHQFLASKADSEVAFSTPRRLNGLQFQVSRFRNAYGLLDRFHPRDHDCWRKRSWPPVTHPF